MALKLAVADIGGTHARFAMARVDAGMVSLSDRWTARVADYACFADCWREYAKGLKSPPLLLSAGIAGTVNFPESLEPIRFTNNHWTMNPASLAAEANLDDFHLLNDFVAIGHAATGAADTAFAPLCGPEGDLPAGRPLTLIGPGTGTGIASLRRGDASFVQGTEGAHFEFAPVDLFDDALLARLRNLHGRVSAERVVSGPGLTHIAAILAGKEPERPLVELWQAGIARSDEIAAQAVERFCMSLGSVAGDVALAQGAKGVIIAGGLGQRLFPILPRSGFADRFRAKGRYRGVMEQMKVRLLTMDEPGLVGAALAFAAR